MMRDPHPPRELAEGDGVTEREIVSLLGLAASQIEVALREEEAPIATLGRGVTQLAGAAAALEVALAALPPDAAAARQAIETQRDTLRAEAREATVALQFHDRLVQRLTHVRDSLAWLGEFVDSHGHHGPAAGWDGLRERIREQYSMQQERMMFDLLVRGATPDEVLHALADLRRGGAAGHVDLF
jgi:hypothetical protein